MLLRTLLFLGLAMLVAGIALTYTSRGSATATAGGVAQADKKTGTDEQVSSDEIKKYVAVYIAMQRDQRCPRLIKQSGSSASRWDASPSTWWHASANMTSSGFGIALMKSLR